MKASFLIIAFFFSLLLVSCREAQQQPIVNQADTAVVKVIKPAIVYVSRPTLQTGSTNLFENKRVHPFSLAGKQDTFSISLTGKTILSGKVIFKIVDFNGRIIHEERLDSYDLLGDEDDVIPTNKLKEDTIINRMQHFFSEDNFIHPAIDTSFKFDPDDSDKELWDDIDADKTAIGFIYSYGYEGTYAIAYSKKKKKTVCYFSSD